MSLLSDQQLEQIGRMPSNKHDAVLSASMAQFTGGYKAASTDVIAASAGISKGLLFHYFGGKAALLHYTAQAAMERVWGDFLAHINLQEGDLFRRLWRITSARFDLLARHPAIFDLLHKVASRPDPEFEAPRQALIKDFPGLFPLSEDNWYQDIDTALFRNGLDVTRAVHVVRWTFAGYAAAMEKPWETGGNPQAVHQRALQELWDYISFFRKQFYA